MASKLSRYGAWLACCLSRGSRSPLGENDVELLVEEMGEVRYAGGTFVFKQGEPAARVHVLRSGAIELSRTLKGRRVILQTLRPGDVFGDVPALLGEPEPFDARAINDCTVLSMDTDALFKMLQTRPLVARRWFISLAERMAGLQQRLVDLLAGGIESQLASILLREADDIGRVSATQGSLADMLGVQRSSVQRVLKSLEAAGLIEQQYRRIQIVDPAGLLSLFEDIDDE
ncbi:MAG: Crp/Fnr family transcriptional regulator [Acidimicrobiales bacterium]